MRSLFSAIIKDVVIIPIKPKRPCKSPMCPNLCDSSYCSDHQRLDSRKLYDKTMRPQYRKLYATVAWQRIRKRILMEQPFCVHCESVGRVTKATDIDHIVDHVGNVSLFYDVSNLQPLCKACHSAKTAVTRGFAKRLK